MHPFLSFSFLCFAGIFCANWASCRYKKVAFSLRIRGNFFQHECTDSVRVWTSVTSLTLKPCTVENNEFSEEQMHSIIAHSQSWWPPAIGPLDPSTPLALPRPYIQRYTLPHPSQRWETCWPNKGPRVYNTTQKPFPSSSILRKWLTNTTTLASGCPASCSTDKEDC